MEFALVNLLELLILPPGGLIMLALAGFVLYRFHRRWGLVLLGCATGLFYLLSVPAVSGMLMRSVEPYPALSVSALSGLSAEAIVVLAGGRLHQQPEYEGDTVSPNTLQRARYGAWLKRRTQLPLYVSGGSIQKGLKPEAELMRDVLQKEFNVEVNVMEDQSKTTYENAKYTAQLLKQNAHHTILLVSAAAHMPRAVEAFEHFGVKVIPAPTVFNTGGDGFSLLDIVPQSYAFRDSYYALHELFGRLWYKLRYY